ncbi:MAG TPA: trigger factor [Patescibacteria group bacterium]|nr:trigger factor [Patescibacteria group bacterium]
MTKPIIERQQDGTIKVTITLPKEDVAKVRVEVVGHLAQHANLPGFRKGKAPSKLVEGNLNPDQVREEILKKLIPQAYTKAIQDENIKPIMNPKLHVEKIEEGEDWVFHAFTCELPEVDLGKYKEDVQKITSKSKIIVPGKEAQKPSMDEIMKAVLEHAKVQVPGILIEQEADRLLAQLLEDIKKLGLSLDQYLASTKRSPEDLRAEYAKRAENDIKLEFVLQKISETEKITVDPKEVEEAIAKAKTPAEKQNLEANRYMLASILRQQKTLDFLMNL